MIDSLDDLLPDMFVELPDCPEALQKQTIRMAAREFCRLSDSYRITLDPVDIVADQEEYTLETGCNASIHRLAWVKIVQADSTEDDTTALSPSEYRLTDECVLKLFNPPDEAITDGLVVRVALRPDFDAALPFSGWYIERYADSILAGAKYRLMRIPRKPWSDSGLAMAYYRDYMDGVNEAKRETFYDYKTGDIMIQSQKFEV